MLTVNGHLSADEIFEKVHKNFTHISRSTVFRILSNLVNEKKLNVVHMSDGPRRFDNILTPHWHFQCKECMHIFDVPASKDIIVNNKALDGFEVDDWLVVYEGLCPECRQKINERRLERAARKEVNYGRFEREQDRSKFESGICR
jgi:Fe2+ or Zn2+ uptake regulation protein